MTKGFFNKQEVEIDLTQIPGNKDLVKPKAPKKQYNCNDCLRCSKGRIKVLDEEASEKKKVYKFIENKNAPAPVEPYGLGKKKIMIVVDEVTEYAQLSGKPLVGNELALLEKAVNTVGLDLYNDCWVVNSIRSRKRAGGNSSIESKACRSILKEDIQSLHPHVIVASSFRALSVLLGHKISIKDDFEKFYGYHIPDQEYKAWIIPTWGSRDFLWLLNNKVKRVEQWAKKALKERGVIPKHLKEALDQNIPLHERNYLKGDEYDIQWNRHIRELSLINDVLHKPVPVDKGLESIEKLTKQKDIEDALQYFSTRPMVAGDIEASSLKLQRPESEILCISFSDGIRSVSFMTKTKLIKQKTAELLNNKSVNFVFHNSNYEYNAFREKWGISVDNQAVDSCLLAHCYDHRKGASGLKFQTAMWEGNYSYGDKCKPFFNVREADIGTKYEKSNLAINKLPEALERGIVYEQGLLFPLDIPEGLPKEDKNLYIQENKRREKEYKQGWLLESEILEYVALDSYYTFRLVQHLKPRLMDEREYQAVKFFTEANIALSKMTFNGIQADLNVIKRSIKELDERIEKFHKEIMEGEEVAQWTGEDPINYNSGAQLGKLLFDILKYPGAVKTKTGYKTDKATLEKLNSPMCKLILEKKALEKVKKTYIEGWYRESDDNGIIKAGFSCNLVSSFRTSSQNPNVQNSIKHSPEMAKLARSFVIPHKNHKLFEFDYASMEARVASIVTQDKTYLRYYSGEFEDADIHAHNAEYIFQVKRDALPSYISEGQEIKPHKKMWKSLRQITKTFTFSSQYGGGAPSITEVIYDDLIGLPLEYRPWLMIHLEKVGITSKEALLERVKKAEYHMWHELFSDYGKWKAEEWKRYKTQGYLRSPTGFVYRGILNSRTSSNYGIQGSATHKLLWAIVLATKEFERLKLESRIIFEVHDSCGVSVAPGEEEIVEKIMTLAMMEGTKNHPLFQWANELEFTVDCDQYEGSWASKATEVRMDIKKYEDDYITL